MINNTTCIQRNIESNENIDKIAQSFFILLVFCSLLSDSYIVFNNFLQNNFVKKNINYYKNIYKIVIGVTFNKYKNDEEGNIIIDNNENQSNDTIDNFDNELSDNFNEILKKNKKDKNIINNTSYNNPFDEDNSLDVVENTLPSSEENIIEEINIINNEIKENFDSEIIQTNISSPEKISDMLIDQEINELAEEKNNTIIKYKEEIILENPLNISSPEIIINKIDEILDNSNIAESKKKFKKNDEKPKKKSKQQEKKNVENIQETIVENRNIDYNESPQPSINLQQENTENKLNTNNKIKKKEKKEK
jgi:hypothetical protein